MDPLDQTTWKNLSTTANFHEYKMIKKLGSGTFGTVFKVHKTKNVNAVYAIKCMQMNRDEDDAGVDEFSPVREISDFLSFKQHHPNVVSVYSATIDVNKKCANLCMELCDEDLEHVLRNNKNISTHTLLQWTYDVFAGLNFLHENGILHGDIKPGNLLLKNNQIKITDFGVSLLNDGYKLDYTHGSRPYVAPEMLCRCSKLISGANDIWAAGLIVAKMFFNFFIQLLPDETLEDYVFRHIGYPHQTDLVSDMMKGSTNCSRALKNLYVTHGKLKLISPEWLCSGGYMMMTIEEGKQNVTFYKKHYGEARFKSLVQLIQGCLQIHPLQRPTWILIKNHTLFDTCQRHDNIHGHYISLNNLAETEYITSRPELEVIIRKVLTQLPVLYEQYKMLDVIELQRTKKEINVLKFDLTHIFVLAGAMLHESLIKLHLDPEKMKHVAYQDRFFHECVCTYIAFCMTDTTSFVDPAIYLKNYLVDAINKQHKTSQINNEKFDHHQLVLYSTLGMNLYALLQK